jgi:hypothetical protein
MADSQPAVQSALAIRCPTCETETNLNGISSTPTSFCEPARW